MSLAYAMDSMLNQTYSRKTKQYNFQRFLRQRSFRIEIVNLKATKIISVFFVDFYIPKCFSYISYDSYLMASESW